MGTVTRCLRAALFLVGALSTVTALQAQPYPSKAIKLLVGYTAGGPVDLAARRLAPVLQKELGQAVVVDNRPGAGGLLASQALAKAEPDGYTLLLVASPTLTITPHLTPNAGFDPLRDYTAIGNVVDYALALLVRSDFKAKTVADLIGLAKANPQAVSFGSAGQGASGHLASELLKKMSGTTMLHVPYKGNAPALTDVIGGKITFVMYAIGDAVPFVRSGQVRALAVTSERRNRALPGVPTMSEAGLAGFNVTGWYALEGPPGLGAAVVARLTAALQKSLGDAELVRQFSDMGYDVAPLSADTVRARIKTEFDLWGGIIKGLKID